MGLSSLDGRRLRGDLTALYLNRGGGEGGADPFSVGSRARMHENGSNLHHGKFRLETRKHFFNRRMLKPWNRLPRDAVDAPSPPVFRRHLLNVPNNTF